MAISLTEQIKKYLKSRAITSPWQITGTSRTDFTVAIIIPALAERENLTATLDSLCLNPPENLAQTLAIIVVNNRADSSADQLENNQQTLNWLKTNPYPQLNLAWVDASSSALEIPAQEGVGLARKIGFDLSLQLLNWNQRPLLISLDADTLVNQSYLPAISAYFDRSQKGGAVIPFRHQPASNPEQEAAIRYYELYLRSYLFGLQLAGSPYAYHCIGSALACRADAYIKAGGMNRRHAAEDFYFLQHLAKTSGIEILSGTIVHPSPRFSNRVPFGTGRAVQSQVEEGITLFNFVPVSGFQLLKSWLGLINRQLNCSALEITQQTMTLSPLLHDFFIELDFVQIWGKLQKTHSSRKQRLSAFHSWFDALRTRQLLMRINNDTIPPAEKLVAELLNWGGYTKIEKSVDQLALLEKLQGV